MAFSLKAWKNKGETPATPLNAGALQDLETRLSAYTESFVNGLFTVGSVTAEKLASGAVTATKLGAEAVETAKIKAAAITEEKLADAAVTSRKVKPTRGLVGASTNLSVLNNTSYVLVPGTEKTITLPTSSKLIVRAVYTFLAIDNHANYGSGDFNGSIYIDNVAQGKIAYFRCDLAEQSVVFAAQGNALAEVEVAAGEHTIKLMAHGATGTEWDSAEVQASTTFYEYEVWSA